MAWTAQTLGVPLLLGVDANHFAADGVQCFNSAAYVARDGRLLGRYDKMHLVMFGEYVPFADYFPWLQRLTPLPISVTPGERPAAFDLCWGGSCTAAPKAETEGRQYNCRPNNVCRLAPNICYESVLSQVIRGQVNGLAAEGREPDVLVNLTNDGWFWGSSAVGLASDLRSVPRGGVPQAAVDRRQYGFFGLDRQRRPHSGARPATRHGGHPGRTPPRPVPPQLVSGTRRLVCRRLPGGLRPVRIGGVARAAIYSTGRTNRMNSVWHTPLMWQRTPSVVICPKPPRLQPLWLTC